MTRVFLTCLVVIILMVSVSVSLAATLRTSWSLDEATGPAASAPPGNPMFRTETGVTSVLGVSGRAWKFDGATGYGHDGQSTPDFTTGSYSITYFMKDSTDNQNEYMLGKGVRTASEGKYYHMTEGGGLMQARMEGPAGEGQRVTNYGVGMFDGRWHHIAQVRDVALNELRLYIDGDPTPVDVQTNPNVSQSVSNIRTLYIGAGELFAGTVSYFSDCALDEVRLYDGVLTPEEITELANVPEPSTFVLLVLGALALVMIRRGR